MDGGTAGFDIIEASNHWGLRERQAASKADSRAAMVKPRPECVHAEGVIAGRRPAYPQGAAPTAVRLQSWGINCAQTAIIPTNSAIDASAAASSTKTFNMSAS